MHTSAFQSYYPAHRTIFSNDHMRIFSPGVNRISEFKTLIRFNNPWWAITKNKDIVC